MLTRIQLLNISILLVFLFSFGCTSKSEETGNIPEQPPYAKNIELVIELGPAVTPDNVFDNVYISMKNLGEKTIREAKGIIIFYNMDEKEVTQVGYKFIQDFGAQGSDAAMVMSGVRPLMPGQEVTFQHPAPMVFVLDGKYRKVYESEVAPIWDELTAKAFITEVITE